MDTGGHDPAQGHSVSSIQAAVIMVPTVQDEWTVDGGHGGRVSR